METRIPREEFAHLPSYWKLTGRLIHCSCEVTRTFLSYFNAKAAVTVEQDELCVCSVKLCFYYSVGLASVDILVDQTL